MTAVQETIYPRLKETVSAQDLARVYTPTEDEQAWVADLTAEADTVARLGFHLYLKIFQRLGYFVPLHRVPARIVEHIATILRQTDDIPHLPAYYRSGNRNRHQRLIRSFLQVKPFRDGGKAIVQQAVAEAAVHHEALPNLINAAIEILIAKRYELPGFTTLVKAAQRQRTATYATWYTHIEGNLTPDLHAQLDTLLAIDSLTGRSEWDLLKDPAGQPTRKNLARLTDRLTTFAPFESAITLALALPESKREHFAAQARSYDRGTMVDIAAPRRYTLLCTWLQQARADLLDDLTDSLIKILREIQADAKEALAAYQQQHQHRTDALVSTLRDVVRGYQEGSSPDVRMSAIDTVLSGQDERLLQDCDAHLTYAGNNWAPFAWGAYKSHRAHLLRILNLLPLQSLSSDRRLLDALTFVREHSQHKRSWLSVVEKEWVNPILYREVVILDLSWLPVGWWRLVTDLPTRTLTPHQVHRQHFEVCVIMQVLSAFNAGDLCVVGAERYGDPLARLYPWDEYHARIDVYGKCLSMSVDPATFVATQQEWLRNLCQSADAGFTTNNQVTVKKGRISLRRHRRRQSPPGLAVIETAIEGMLTPRSILHALLMTDQWINWTRFFGPISGLEAKIDEAAAKYVAATFCYGCQIGPSATARSLGTLDRRQLSRIDQVHISEPTLDQAIQCLIEAYQRCPLPRLWGSGDHASADGTKWEVYEQSLLSEQHIRYGGYGGIALYLVSSTYIALMANVIACSIWEGHYLLDLLEQNESVIQPTMIHSDTQGQNEAIFGLAWLRGIDLLPRIRRWQYLTMYRPDPDSKYTHIDSLFAKQAINWNLIQTHLPDLLRIALSIQDGRIKPSMIMRLLSAGKSHLAQAARELGRARRTGMLLRCFQDPDLRALIQRETNKSEQFNNFVKWVGFGSAGVIRHHDRAEQQKAIKYTMLVANALILYTTVKLSDAFRRLIATGTLIDPSIIAAFNPYRVRHLERFGKYWLELEEPVLPVDYDSPVISQPAKIPSLP